jgi:dUTP pyrophosphatase
MLNESQFNLVAPVFLEELEKTYNDANTRLLMVQAINAAGLHAEDLQDECLRLCEVIDDQTANILSASKRDFLKGIVTATYNSVAGAEGIAKKTINIPIEFCHPDAKMPAYAHLSDAGMDVYALEEITINPGESKLIPLGIKVAVPLGYELQVRPKSGVSAKTKLRVANAPGTIDAGYRDEIGVIVENVEPPIKDITYEPVMNVETGMVDYLQITSILYGKEYTIGKGQKFAQLVLSEVPKAVLYEVESVGEIGEDRGGGFGSTGLK